MKGFFSQGFCLLTNGRTTIDEVKAALAGSEFHVAKEVPANENPCFSGPAVIIAFHSEVNGYISVDVVNQIWPDAMGDPTSDFMTFGAWSTGNFGPYAYPGGLTRAQQNAWLCPNGKLAAQSHSGFVRLRLSYIFGLPDKAPVLPKDYNPLDELNFLTRLTLPILALPSVTCYFNPNGEVLRDRLGFEQVWSGCVKQEKLPLSLWSNIRLFNLNKEFLIMDTVGNAQLDVQDIEVVFPKAKYNPGDVDYYMRNVTHYLLDTNREIRTGEAFDGPNESGLSWVVNVLENGLMQPPRTVLRLIPRIDQARIEGVIVSMGYAI